MALFIIGITDSGIRPHCQRIRMMLGFIFRGRDVLQFSEH